MSGDDEMVSPVSRSFAASVRRWCVILVMVAVVGVGGLIAVGHGLSYDDARATAPVVIVLGEMSEVYQFAADASRDPGVSIGVATYAPRRGQRIGAVPGDAETARRDLATRGVPPSEVFEISTSAHTSHDLLRAIERWRQHEGVDGITLACGNLGSRYWKIVCDQTFNAENRSRYHIVSVPTPQLTPTRWFRSRYGGKLVLGALLRWMFVAVHGESQWQDRDIYERLDKNDSDTIPAAA